MAMWNINNFGSDTYLFLEEFNELPPMKVEPIQKSQGKDTFRNYVNVAKEEENKQLIQRQKSQFCGQLHCSHEKPLNLTYCFSCLFKREYGECHLFNDANKDPLFIPSFYCSKVLRNERETATLDFDLKNDIENYKENCQYTWLKTELDNFLFAIDPKNENNCYQDNKLWGHKMRVLYLMHEQNTEELPSATDDRFLDLDFMEFISECLEKGQNAELEKAHDGAKNTFSEKLFKYFELEDVSDLNEGNERVKKILKNKYKIQKTNPVSMVRERLRNSDEKKELKKHFNDYLDHLKGNLTRIFKEKNINSNLRWIFDRVDLREIMGERVEYWLYQELKHMKELLEKFVIIHSLQLTEVEKKYESEFDFLLLSAERKLIIAIEAKNTLYMYSKKKYQYKPFHQLAKCYEMLSKYLGDCFTGHGEQWKFVPLVFTFNETDYEKLRPYHEKINVVSKSSIKEHLKNIMQQFPSSDSQESKDQLKEVLGYIVCAFHSSNNKEKLGAITPSKWVKYTQKTIDAISKKENIIFYSKNQLPVMTNERFKKLILSGEYGSGKSILMKHKAEQLSSKNEAVIYIFGNKYCGKTLLQIDTEEKWRNKNIEVISLHELCRDRQDDIVEKLSVISLSKHIFIDELDMDCEKEIKSLCSVLKENKEKFVWITFNMKTYQNVFKGLVENNKYHEFDVCDLGHSMRNTKSVVEEAQEIHNELGYPMHLEITEPPPNFIEGEYPFTGSLQSIFEKIEKKFCNEKCGKGILFISSDVKINTHLEEIKGYCNNEIIGYYIVYKRDETSYINSEHEHLKVRSSQCLSYLKKRSILITNSYAAEGFEWPNVITLGKGSFLNADHTDSVVNRVLRSNCDVYLIDENND